jgi:pimeloyl-ACP methyl ester carboxylesterase
MNERTLRAPAADTDREREAGGAAWSDSAREETILTSSRSAHDLRALWFGEPSLLGHLHTPRGAALDLAVVICATPFGYENICGHRGLRILGDRLAAAGIATLRFDVPGTGDSDGEQRVPAWKASVGDAVATLRRETGCAHIGLIGVGLGGTIALACLDEGLDVEKLILWGTPTTGRSWLRAQRAYKRFAVQKPDSDGPPPPPSPEGIEELSGFPLTAALSAELTALDVAKGVGDSWPAARARPATLAISRNASVSQNDLAGSLRARGISVEVEARDGFDPMYAEPHLSIAPEDIFARMRDWLADGVTSRAPYALSSSVGKGVATRIGKNGLVEEIARYTEGDGGLLFSIETRPVGRASHPTWLILLTGRAVRHIGPNRIWVRFAREVAARGFASLRLDGRSVGDSEGEGNGLMPNAEYYQEHIYDDIERVMELGTAAGAGQFLMTGICSGATASYQVAWRRPDVRAIVLLNPLQLRHDPEDDERAKVDLAKRWSFRKELWTDPQAYVRAFKGEFPLRQVLKVLFLRARGLLSLRGRPRADEPSYVVTGFHSLARKPVEIDIFLSGADEIAVGFLERHFGVGLVGFDREHLRVHRVPGADHTIRPLFAQERFFDLLRTALGRIAKDGG